MSQSPLLYHEYRKLGASEDLPENGSLRFVLSRDEHDDLPCFVVRKRGKLHAFLNRCMHWPITLDMETNDFWDYDERYLQCRTHGALYDLEGLCIAGPCTGERLIPLPVFEEAGVIYLDGTRLSPRLEDE